jgi:uncharacterized protein (TIGR00255 family)
MKSMTGYGRSSSRQNKKTKPASSGKSLRSPVELEIAIRAVNGRYLELRFHFPREYAQLESEFKSIIGKTFSRGTLDIYVNRLKSNASSAEVSVNTELGRQWLAAYRKLAKDLKISTDVSLDMIARVPDILRVEEHMEVSDSEKALAKKLMAEAVLSCDQERSREGLALQSELLRLCKSLESIGDEVETLKAEASSELENRYRERLRESLHKFGAEGAVDESRLAQEIVMQIDRADVSEEISRLKEHLKAYRDLLKSREPQGKKLDFYAQELLREVNTIGSKSHIAKLTSRVVEAKTLVEKIREQVQNAE